MLGAIKCYFMCVALLQNILLAAHHRNTMRFRIYEGMGRGNETVEKISGEKKKKSMKSRDELSEEADLYAEYTFLRVQEYIFLRIHTRILVCNPLVGLQMSTEKRDKINLISKESHA